VKLLKEFKAIIGMSRAREKKLDKYHKCTKFLLLILYPPSSKPGLSAIFTLAITFMLVT
jgi:hypothetical protein